MTIQDRAKSVWFGAKRSEDARLLADWRTSPITYQPGQENGPEWFADRYEIELGQDDSGKLFERASRLVLNNRFYPPEVMVNTSDFGLEKRPVREGDRVLQRIRLFQMRSLPVLEVLTMNEITEVIQEPRRAGFTYTTTAAHSELGEWAPQVEWREDGRVMLVIGVVSRTRPGANKWARQFARMMQIRAHKLSIENFLTLLRGDPRSQAVKFALVPADLMPVWLILLAVLVSIGAVVGYRRRG